MSNEENASDEVRLKMDEGIVLQLGKKMYSQSTWWVLLRELLQNSLDSNASKIEISLDRDSDKAESTITVKDNGIGMSKQELLDVFLTVGGTNKIQREGIIGGFGIAKLAIFSCTDFYVISNGWRLCKEDILEHNHIQQDDSCFKGTIVCVKDGSFNLVNRSEISLYLSSVKCDATITFNGEDIVPNEYYDLSIYEVGPVLCIDSNYVSNPQLWVRVNGLPAFRYVLCTSRCKQVLFMDVQTDLNPYDSNYPLTMTRDCFAPGNMSNLYRTLQRKLIEHFSKIELSFKLEQAKLVFHKEYGIWTSGNARITSDSLRNVENFKKAIHLIQKISQEDDPTAFGVCPGLNAGYYAHKDQDVEIYFIGEEPMPVSSILARALHEYTHHFYNMHYDSFAHTMTSLTDKLLFQVSLKTDLNSLLEKDFSPIESDIEFGENDIV